VSAVFDGVDWEVVAVFAALVLLEGLRRIPAGGLVVRAFGWRAWKPVGQVGPTARWALVSWWSPAAPALVLPPLGVESSVSTEELAGRVRLARRAAPWLAAGSALTLATLVLGVPLASARFGGLGFIAAAAVVLALTLATAAGGWRTLQRLDAPAALRRRLALGWCSPFASGRVLEGVYQAAVTGASPAQALRLLADERVFVEWARLRAYDSLHGGQTDLDLSAAASAATLYAIISAEPPLATGGKSYCPRCATVWVMVRDACPDCGVPAVSRATGS
jgi:hypothetical protein